MKKKMVLQAGGKEIDLDDFLTAAKEAWKGEGRKIKDIEGITIYLKPEERACYFVINENFKGSVVF